MKQIHYRQGLKYALAEPYTDTLPIYPPEAIASQWVNLGRNGEFMLREGFAWDGPSGPTIDTKSAMRGSAIHDGLYRLMRLGLLDEKWRKTADEIYEQACISDGMFKVRAWLHFRALRRFGWLAAEKGTEPPIQTAP